MSVQRIGTGIGVVLMAFCVLSSSSEGETVNKAAEEVVEDGPIQVEAIVSASVDDVWHAWTTNDGVRSFFAKDSNVELRIGGPFEILFDADAADGEKGSEGCTFLSYLPKEIISFSWNAPPKFSHARGRHTWVVLRLEKVSADKTRVRISHLGWREKKTQHPDQAGEWDEVRTYFTKAWPYVLENLKKRFEGGPRWGCRSIVVGEVARSSGGVSG